MVKTSSLLRYESRIQAVIDYIYHNLDAELDLMHLADVANMSAYHWHRVFQGMTGQSVIATVKQLRLHKAAAALANSEKPIAKIAARFGYGNIQSFTRIFHDVYGMSPADYRNNGLHRDFQLPFSNKELEIMYPVEIVNIDTMRGLGVKHQGSYMDIGKAFEKLYVAFATRKMMENGMRSVGIYYNDPNITPENQLQSVACLLTDQPAPQDSPLSEVEIAGGKYAKLSFSGPYANLDSAYNWLYGDWLKSSDYELGNAPCFEEYLNNPRDTAPSDLKTEVYLSLV